MSSSPFGSLGGVAAMTAYDADVWHLLNDHWERRSRRRSVPTWVSGAAERSGEFVNRVAGRVASAIPEPVKRPVRDVSETVMSQAARPALAAAANVLDLINAWAMELNDPRAVEKIARKRGLEIDSFSDLRSGDLRSCDRLLTFNTLKWRTIGALEGGAMGVLALVPIAGLPVAITADLVVIQVLSVSIATRVAYSYGYDAKDPREQEFVDRLVRRSFMAQAAKVVPLRDISQAAQAVNGRVRWSAKLRADHRLLAAVERLLQQIGPKGAHVSVQSVAKALPFLGALVGAGLNAAVLGNVALDARRYCQTRFLCEKYGLDMPAALATPSDAEFLELTGAEVPPTFSGLEADPDEPSPQAHPSD